MPVSVSSLRLGDVLGALAGASEATFLWAPEGDSLEWVVAPSTLLEAPTFSDPTTGATWRALISSGDVDARDAWIKDPQGETVFTGTYAVGPAEDGLWVEERIVRIDDAVDGSTLSLIHI